MIKAGVDVISQKVDKINLGESGVSFEGKTLKLDKAEDWDKIVDAIEKCKRLDFLNLEGNTLSVDASKAIAKALESKPELKRVLWKDIFTGRMKEEIPKALLNLGSGLTLAGARLTELDMGDNAFGPIGVEGLAGLLNSPTCYQLQQLKLNNNGLGISGGKILAKSLLECYENSLKEGKPLALKVFIAGRNRLENEGTKALSKVFETVGSLEEVVMPQNGIYPEGIKALSKSFILNKNLRVINLNDNTVTKSGATSIAKALPHLKKLQILNLGDCLLKTQGAKVLAAALTEGQRDLKELYLSSNEIKCSGGLAVARAMKNKDKLHILDLDGNNFGEEGCRSVTKAMEDINRASFLGTLEDDEGDDGSGSENTENEQEDGSESEYEGENGSETDKSMNVSETKVLSSNVSLNGENNLDQLSSMLETTSLGDKETESVYMFLSCPTINNFKKLDKKSVISYIKNIENSSSDLYFDKLIQLIMKISSLSTTKDDARSQIIDMTFDLYRTLFLWAKEKNQISAVNNALVVYLGLIKSEDKDFKFNWDTEGSISALKNAISKGIVPESTEKVFECCLTREKNL